VDQVHEQKCAACGGPLRFDPETGKLVCDYCGTVYEIGEQETPQPEETLDGYDFAALSAHAASENAEGLPIYNCVSCGAEVIASTQEMALTCPYCGNNIVLTEKVSGNLRPDGVIPFKITAKVLPQVLTEFYKDKKLLPKNFFNDSRMEKVTGVYVPFWVFSGRLSGRLQFKGDKSSSHRSGDYIITDTEHYLVGRDVSMDFKDLPVDASGRVEDELMDSLEPFGMEDVKPFHAVSGGLYGGPFRQGQGGYGGAGPQPNEQFRHGAGPQPGVRGLQRRAARGRKAEGGPEGPLSPVPGLPVQAYPRETAIFLRGERADGQDRRQRTHG